MVSNSLSKNTPEIQIHVYATGLCAIGFDAEGAPHWTAPMDTSVTCFVVLALFLIALLLAGLFSS